MRLPWGIWQRQPNGNGNGSDLHTNGNGAAAADDGGASATLSIDDAPVVMPRPNPVKPITGSFQAIVNVTGDNLYQIEVAIKANAHATDPHPSNSGEAVNRHPIFIVGEPAELDLAMIRQLYSKRYPYVSPDAPPE